MCIYFETLSSIRAKKFALFRSCNCKQRKRRPSILSGQLLIAVAFEKSASNAFSYAQPEKTFTCLRARRQLDLHLMIVITAQYITSARIHRFKNGISPLSHKISYKGKLRRTTAPDSRRHEPPDRRRAWNSIIAPVVACITAPSIAKAARRGISISTPQKWDKEGEEHARC